MDDAALVRDARRILQEEDAPERILRRSVQSFLARYGEPGRGVLLATLPLFLNDDARDIVRDELGRRV